LGKGSGRREGANDKAFKAAAWPPESPHVRVDRRVWRSECCEAPPVDQVSDGGAGHCRKCGEPTQFYYEGGS
jgi:hypothetical protein